MLHVVIKEGKNSRKIKAAIDEFNKGKNFLDAIKYDYRKVVIIDGKLQWALENVLENNNIKQKKILGFLGGKTYFGIKCGGSGKYRTACYRVIKNFMELINPENSNEKNRLIDTIDCYHVIWCDDKIKEAAELEFAWGAEVVDFLYLENDPPEKHELDDKVIILLKNKYIKYIEKLEEIIGEEEEIFQILSSTLFQVKEDKLYLLSKLKKGSFYAIKNKKMSEGREYLDSLLERN